MPITVRIAHMGRIASKRLTPRMRNVAKWGLVAGEETGSAMKAAARRRKSAARPRITAERMRQMGRFMTRSVGRSSGSRTIFRPAASPDRLED
jgi:hypothetical protein